jgi:hypothetical protein
MTHYRPWQRATLMVVVDSFLKASLLAAKAAPAGQSPSRATGGTDRNGPMVAMTDMSFSAY